MMAKIVIYSGIFVWNWAQVPWLIAVKLILSEHLFRTCSVATSVCTSLSFFCYTVLQWCVEYGLTPYSLLIWADILPNSTATNSGYETVPDTTESYSYESGLN